MLVKEDGNRGNIRSYNLTLKDIKSLEFHNVREGCYNKSGNSMEWDQGFVEWWCVNGISCLVPVIHYLSVKKERSLNFVFKLF